MIARYRFQRFPNPLPILGGAETIKLQVGDFNGIQINEIAIYSDGLLVESGTDTDTVEAFLEDFYGFIAEQFSVARLETPGEKRHYDSAVVVEMDEPVANKFNFLSTIYSDLGEFRHNYGFDDEFAFHGFRVETDLAVHPGSGGPKFTFERRVRVPFSENYWFSNAPLKTKDHLAILEHLEGQLRR